MIDKEKIIIDTVDVSECEYVCNTAFGNIGCKLPFNEEIHCCNIPNCYFKQLKRKEELLRQAGNHIKDLDLMVHSGEERENELEQQLQRKAQECKQKDKTIAGLVGCVSLWEEFSDEESRLAKSSSIADLVVLLREARSSLENKTAECEELKKKFSKFFNIDNQECWDIAFLKDENARYKQALDEIEEIANEPCIADTQEDCKSCDGNCEHKDILGIIRKAKGADNHG